MWVNQQMEVQKSQADSSNSENKGSVLGSDGSVSPSDPSPHAVPTGGGAALHSERLRLCVG